MPLASGVITKIYSKEIDEDKYGNTFRLSFQLDSGDEWYGAGAKKKAAIAVQQGKDKWYDLQEGDEVEFTYTVNGDFLNVKASKIEVVAYGEGAPKSEPPKSTARSAGKGSPAGARPAAGGGAAKTSVSRINPEYAVGRWVNGAVALVAAGTVADLKAGVLQTAAVELWASTHFERILEEAKGVKVPGVTEDKPPAARRAAPPEPDEQEDDGQDDQPPEAPPEKPAPRRRAAAAPKAAAPARKPREQAAAAASEPPAGEPWDDEIPF